jgi:hypothetical protein
MAWSKQGGEYKRPKNIEGLPARRARSGVELRRCGVRGCKRLHAWKSPGTPETGAELQDTPACSTRCLNLRRIDELAAKRKKKIAEYLAWRQALRSCYES